MTSGQRALMYMAAWMCGLLCLAAAVWTVGALRDSRGSPADSAGLLVGLAGAALAVWGLWVAVRALREQRTVEIMAAELARAVLEEEGKQYKQLLGGDRQALNSQIDVCFVLAAGPNSPADGENLIPDGTLGSVTEYYRSLASGRLVITGASAAAGSNDAGSGKTVLAVALILGLARDRVGNEPVPIRLSASSWSGETVRDWLVRHLASVFHLHRREARALVEAHLVLPVIDGLDEMDATQLGYASRAARLLRVVEGYEQEGEKAPVVITCRRPHYAALVDAAAELQLATHIEIARVDVGRIGAYLADRVGHHEQSRARWKPLMDAVATSVASSALIEALNTPWQLTLAAVVYEERDPCTGRFLRNPMDLVRRAESGELHEYLLDRYIKAAVNASFGDHERRSRYHPDPAAVWRYLAVLADYLESNTGVPPRAVAGRELSGTDIVLHELWPLAGPRRPRVVSALLMLLAGLGILVLYLVQGAADASGGGTVIQWAVATVVATAAAFGVAWPQPARISFRPLTTLSGVSHTLSGTLACGLFGGLIAGCYYNVLNQSASGGTPHLPWNVIHWPSVPAWMGLGCLLSLTLSIRDHSVSGPRSPLRGDLTVWFASGCIVGALQTVILLSAPVGADVIALSGPGLIVGVLAYGLVVVLGWGVVFSVKNVHPATRGLRGALGGPAFLRYASLLLCTRGRLPWRLAGFLRRCYELGLLRVAGAAYQFRHRELQEHLASRPYPPGFR